jgi:hypothetical protein
MNELRKRLTISRSRLDEINQLLADPKNPLVNGLLEIVKEVPNIGPNTKVAIRKRRSAWTIPRIFWTISCPRPTC